MVRCGLLQSGTRSGQSGGSIALNMREFLETAVQLLQQLGRGDLPPDRQKYKFSVDDLRSARVHTHLLLNY